MCHFPSCLRRRCSVEKVLGFCHSSVRDCEYEVAVAVNLWLKMHWGTKLVVSGFFSLLKQLVHTSMYLAVQDAASIPRGKRLRSLGFGTRVTFVVRSRWAASILMVCFTFHSLANGNKASVLAGNSEGVRCAVPFGCRVFLSLEGGSFPFRCL